jgi:hypothetical protein
MAGAGRENQRLLVSHSHDGGLKSHRAVVVTPEPEDIVADGENRPKVAVAKDGTVILSWTQALPKGHAGNIRFARSTDSGKTFSSPITLNDDGRITGHRFDALTIDGSGRVVVAWLDAHRVYSSPADRSTGIICDQRIILDGYYISQDYPEQLRRIRFKDPESGKTLVFLTNNTTLPALTIAALYKSRWQVELFFKWIKQHLRIKRFIGNSENAVKTQIWCAVSTYVLIAIVKKELQLNASLYSLLQILSVSVFEKTQLSQAFAGSELFQNQTGFSNQLNLFDS